MSDFEMQGSDILDVLNRTRSPLERAQIRNDALSYLKACAERVPESKRQACLDYVANFDTFKNISDQMRDLAVWVDEVNVLIQQYQDR